MKNYNNDNSFIGNQLNDDSENPNFDFVQIKAPNILTKKSFVIETDANSYNGISNIHKKKSQKNTDFMERF